MSVLFEHTFTLRRVFFDEFFFMVSFHKGII